MLIYLKKIISHCLKLIREVIPITSLFVLCNKDSRMQMSVNVIIIAIDSDTCSIMDKNELYDSLEALTIINL